MSSPITHDPQQPTTSGPRDNIAMTGWTADELDRVGAAEELEIASTRSDGSQRGWVRIWVVRVLDELYVRSYRGNNGAWFRQAARRGTGRIRAGGVQRDVTVHPAEDTAHPAIDDAYRVKYARYGDSYLEPMLGPGARAATLRLAPATTGPDDLT